MIVFVHGLVLTVLSFLLWKRESSAIKIFFWPALLLKLFCGVALGWLYIHYYSLGDTISYFEDGTRIAHLAKEDIGSYFDFLYQGDSAYSVWSELNYQQPRALFLSKIASIFCLISTDSYGVVTLYFSFASFLGAWYLAKYLSEWATGMKPVAVVSLLFFPSIVFWTSGLVKESLSMAALYFLVVIFLKVYKRDKVLVWESIGVPFALWVLWNLKYYYLAIFLPVVCAALIMKLVVYPRVRFKSFALELAIWLIIFVVPVSIVSQLHPNFYPERFLGVIVDNYHEFEKKSDNGDMVMFDGLSPTAGSVIRYVPKAVFTGLFRPMFWESQNTLQLVVALENLMTFLLTIFALANIRKVPRSPDRLLLYSVIVYVVLLCALLTLSTPNYGTLVRYRVGFLPFFLVVILIENRLFQKSVAFLETIFSGFVRK